MLVSTLSSVSRVSQSDNFQFSIFIMPNTEFNVEHLANLNPNAREVKNFFYKNGGSTRMGAYFRQLHQEILDRTTRRIIDDLLYYTTKLDGTKGMEEKLRDGGFSDRFIREAMRKKLLYAKKAEQFSNYPSAQEINLLIFADIVNAFQVYIEPMINCEAPIDVVMVQIHERVVVPIMEKINENGVDDTDLHYTSDHIYGMIYYLTGMCHLNWKNYDNI